MTTLAPSARAPAGDAGQRGVLAAGTPYDGILAAFGPISMAVAVPVLSVVSRHQDCTWLAEVVSDGARLVPPPVASSKPWCGFPSAPGSILMVGGPGRMLFCCWNCNDPGAHVHCCCQGSCRHTDAST
jgi:hypothetical protein